MSTLSISRTLPLDDAWDVIVVGGGPAGVTAAAAAAREGARTLLLEATGCLGGMGTSGLVPAWMTFGDREKMIVRGYAGRVFAESCATVANSKPEECWGPIDPEGLKRIYDDLVTEAGATVRFNTMYAGAETDGAGTVTSILAASKAGLTAFRAPVYVDATGDGDIAVAAGAAFEQGDARTGEIMPVTLCFILANVDAYGYLYGKPMWPHVIQDILDSGEFPAIPDGHFCNNLIGPNTVGFNAGHMWEVDNTDPVAVSQAMMQGRKIAKAFRDALAKFHPTAFANAYLASTAALIGARETRRIVGDYVLTMEDFFARRTFTDDICRNAYPIDIHTAKNEVEESRAGKLDVMARYEHFKPGESHGIPYRSLTPKGVRNVLVAGRAVSCDRPVQAAIRVMSVCLGMGEAAGLAAALAARADGDVHAIDTARLRARLLEEGAYLPEAVAAGK